MLHIVWVSFLALFIPCKLYICSLQLVYLFIYYLIDLITHLFELSPSISERKWKSHSHVQLFATPWTIYRLCSSWNSPRQNTRVGSHSLLQGIFPTQGFVSIQDLCSESDIIMISHSWLPSDSLDHCSTFQFHFWSNRCGCFIFKDGNFVWVFYFSLLSFVVCLIHIKVWTYFGILTEVFVTILMGVWVTI